MSTYPLIDWHGRIKSTIPQSHSNYVNKTKFAIQRQTNKLTRTHTHPYALTDAHPGHELHIAMSRVTYCHATSYILLCHELHIAMPRVTYCHDTSYILPWHEWHIAMTRVTYCHDTSYILTWHELHIDMTRVTYCHDTSYILPWHELHIAMIFCSIIASDDCHFSYSGNNPFVHNISVDGIFHDYCSAACRESDYPFGAVHVSKLLLRVYVWFSWY